MCTLGVNPFLSLTPGWNMVPRAGVKFLPHPWCFGDYPKHSSSRSWQTPRALSCAKLWPAIAMSAKPATRTEAPKCLSWRAVGPLSGLGVLWDTCKSSGGRQKSQAAHQSWTSTFQTMSQGKPFLFINELSQRFVTLTGSEDTKVISLQMPVPGTTGGSCGGEVGPRWLLS